MTLVKSHTKNLPNVDSKNRKILTQNNNPSHSSICNANTTKVTKLLPIISFVAQNITI